MSGALYKLRFHHFPFSVFPFSTELEIHGKKEKPNANVEKAPSVFVGESRLLSTVTAAPASTLFPHKSVGIGSFFYSKRVIFPL